MDAPLNLQFALQIQHCAAVPHKIYDFVGTPMI